MRLAAALLAALVVSPAPAAVCHARSPAHTVALVELYTSEGCSSCPPAERWLSSVEARKGRGRVVPIALHVDYWDDLGWRDPYARHAFAQRQRRLAALNGARFVYTPQVLLQGADFRRWGTGALERALREIDRRPALARIALSVDPAAGGRVALEAKAALLGRGGRDAALFLATYESGLVSRVSAGENRGRTLTHDRVVRDWKGPYALPPEGSLTVRTRLALPPEALAGRSGVVAFVQDRRSGAVLQALAMPGCSP